jgi:hypothetical protein
MPPALIKLFVLACCTWPFAVSASLRAAEPSAGSLPFAPEAISRLSLDGKPRSLSIRQGPDVWLGYDLERATLLKVWRASPGKSGLIKSGFSTRSSGVRWFEDSSDAGWEIRRGETTVPLTVRYLGCSQRKDHFELRWELRDEARTLQLFERVPLVAAEAGDRVVRELRVETLSPDESLLPPATVRKAWRIALDIDTAKAGSDTVNADAQTPAGESSLRGNRWHRLTLP